MVAAPVETEQERVLHWRERCLLDAGYPADAVPSLAAARDVDLTVACSLLSNGCDPLIAVAILL